MTDQQKLQALVHLSSWRQVPVVDDLTRLICQSPDPETARREVLQQIEAPSEVICQKWLETVDDLWFAEHPAWPLLLHLPLTTEDIMIAPVVEAARAFLAAMAERPLQLDEAEEDLPLVPQEVVPMRRMRALLIALRLLRVQRGQLVLNRGRYQRWQSFPRLQQFYILWHAEVHHLDWSMLVGTPWSPYLQLIQEYMPVLWDVSGQQTGLWRPEVWSRELVASLAWLWQRGHRPLFPYEQFMLPQVLEQFLIHDLLGRYGFMSLEGPYARWTPVGQAMIAAESNASLPCGMTLLE